MEVDLTAPLRRYWGYDTFRPMQERIVRSLLGGNDLAVIMPTGGGKSLCYQLPALVLGRTAVVVSPLIALMQDQAAQLRQMGIPSAVVNSTQSAGEQNEVMREATRGAYRLLYLSPERLVRSDTAGWLQRVPVSFFAIDEAHCISEWGHEFRPEYRQLSCLREIFPDKPIAAFTASATRRVRHDILEQLRLREPHKYIASFHRRNLRYLVHACDGLTQPRLLVSALRAHEGSNVIVYAPTIATVDKTVDFLAERGIAAVPYHGKMDTEARSRNQERWMSDEVPVLVGTIAFGLGINKPSVRAVIHLSLPKSIEQFYQEAGRAGRDGEPADCALLWQKKDAGLLAYFIEQLEDRAERERSWERYHVIRRFVESARCRHRQICLHFGETPKWDACGACDVCAPLPDWLDHPVEEPAGKRSRIKKTATAAAPAPKAAATPPAPVPHRPHSQLFDYLREWRRETARRNNIPAFMVLTDASLEDLCRKQPKSLRELLHVEGIGERKAETYGRAIFSALETFQSGQRASAAPAPAQQSPAEETMRLLAEGKSFSEIATIRNRQLATVVGLVAELIEKSALPFDPHWVREESLRAIEQATKKHGLDWLKPLREGVPPEVTAEEIRLVVAKLRREKLKETP
ncbi:MAG: RecQ family ATP-dependent DNA helicase [Bryobacteraceae bacterium]